MVIERIKLRDVADLSLRVCVLDKFFCCYADERNLQVIERPQNYNRALETEIIHL